MQTLKRCHHLPLRDLRLGIDLLFRPTGFMNGYKVDITPRTPRGTTWLSTAVVLLVELDKPVTLSLEGAKELHVLAHAEGLSTEGL
jgi:hypothetical protein